MSREPRWNTSEGLGLLHPEIINSCHWPEFARVYDDPECRATRLHRWQEAHPPQAKKEDSLDHLRELADWVLGSHSARLLFAEKVLSQGQAATQLARNVLGLLSTQNPLPLRELLEGTSKNHFFSV